ncbi:MAG: protein jag [Clostridia bacterium]|nr:protein jag [Clostridia bacterium]
MEYTEFSGKTVAEAVKKGLKELGLTEENASIRVLEEGKIKLFGSIKARVEIAPLTVETEEEKKEEIPVATPVKVKTDGETSDGQRAVEFLDGLFQILKITATTELVSEGEKIEIEVTAANTNSVIGKRGATLDAIQTLAGAVANTGRDDYKRVVVDCEGYRESREATLQRLAQNLAARATRLGKKIKLEPMNPYERRIIHAALSEEEGIKTESAGKEPQRYVVIVPENADPEEEPIPARTERDERRGGRSDRGGYSRGGRNDRGGRGGKGGFNRRPSGGGKSSGNGGGTTMKKSSDFFGTFLGNSKDQ